MRDRVYEFVSDGVDMIVSTDHNVVSNYQPVIADLHARSCSRPRPATRSTTARWGHFGAFPLPHDMETRATARSRSRRPPTESSARSARPHPTRSSTSTIRGSRRPSATSSSASSTTSTTRRRARASRTTSMRSKSSTATRTRTADDRSRDEGLVRAARSRPPRHRDRQLRHAPPQVQPRRLPAKLRDRRERRAGLVTGERHGARRQGSTTRSSRPGRSSTSRRHDRHRRPRARAERQRERDDHRARRAVGVGVARDPLRRAARR